MRNLSVSLGFSIALLYETIADRYWRSPSTERGGVLEMIQIIALLRTVT